MKIEIDKDKLKDVTGENINYICPEELFADKNRLLGMITNDIMFCTVITGYRGTGKTSFVRNIIKSLPKDVISVTINATKYKEYEVFIKRFIRELYLRYTGDVPIDITELYLHTFYDIKNFGKLEKKYERDKKKNSYDKKTITGTIGLDLKKIIIFFLTLLICYAMLWVGNKVSQDFIGKIAAVITMCSYVFANIKINTDYINSNEIEEVTSSESHEGSTNNISLETLYDNEIAEYHLFDALEKTHSKGKRFLIVLDEVDKMENNDLKKIFSELKPLFLSSYCNVIVVAGKNVDSFLSNEDDKEDSVVNNMFSQRIYVSLSSVNENKIFLEQLFIDNLKNKVILDDNIQSYIKKIVILANGNKRKLINMFLADIEWEDENAFILINDNSIEKSFQRLYDVIVKMEDYIFTTYERIESDEALYHIYQWIRTIRKQKNDIFNEKIIIDMSYKEKNKVKNIEENIELCKELLKSMVEEQLLKIENDGYIWNYINEEAEIDTRIHYDQVSQNVSRFKEVENLLFAFGNYNGLGSINFNEMINIYYQKKIISEEDLKLLMECSRKVDECRIGKVKNEFLKALSDLTTKLVRRKPFFGENLLEWTLIQKNNYQRIHDEKLKMLLINSDIDSSDRYTINHIKRKYDICLQGKNSERIIIIETKFYKNLISGIKSRLLEIVNEFKYLEFKFQDVSFSFAIIFFTDQKAEYIREAFRKNVEDVLYESNNKNINIVMEVISINDSFFEDMDRTLNQINF